MKHEYIKHEKELYGPTSEPKIITVPKQKYFCMKGVGDPNQEDFAARVGVLYSLAYAIKMMPRNGFIPTGYYDYTVYPLEGIWDLNEEGRKSENWQKDQLEYIIMIRQPEFVNEAVVAKAYHIVSKKKPHPLLSAAYFAEIEDGLCIQMMHKGPYDDEPLSFAKMNSFIEQNHYKRTLLTHREIYLSDFRRTEPSKLKTILRYFIQIS